MTLRDALDVNIENLRANFILAQDNFYYVYGRYWQGLITHDTLPSDGLSSPIEDLNKKPESEPFGWQNFSPYLPSELRAALQVDNYDGPEGKGFCVRIFAKEDGKVYTRVLNHGPDLSLEKNWEEVVPNPYS